MVISNVDCPTCASKLYFDSATLTYKCESCGGFFDKDQVVRESLLKRAYFSLRAKEYTSASHNFEGLLEKDPHNIFALRGKLLAESEMSDFTELGNNISSKFFRLNYSEYANQATEGCRVLFNSCENVRRANSNYVQALNTANQYQQQSNEMGKEVNRMRVLAEKDIMQEPCHYADDGNTTVLSSILQTVWITVFFFFGWIFLIVILCVLDNSTIPVILKLLLGIIGAGVMLLPLLGLRKPFAIIKQHKLDIQQYGVVLNQWNAFNVQVQQAIQVRDQMLQIRQTMVQALVQEDSAIMAHSPVR